MAFGRIVDRVLLFPQVGPEDAAGATRHRIAHDGGVIEVWRASSPGARDLDAEELVLRFYGNADRADRWVSSDANELGERRVELWGMNYPGYGGSTGPATLEGIVRAAHVVFAELQTYARGRPIYVHGTSIGTTAALAIASRYDVAGVRLQNPVPLREIIRGEHGWWNAWVLAYPVSLQVPNELDSIANASRCKAPAVFVMSEKDEVVPPKYQKLVFDAYAGPKRSITMRGALHNDPVPAHVLYEVTRLMDVLRQGGR